MTRPDFERAIRKIDLPLNDTQIEALFDVIDANQDGKIDRFDWMRALPNQSNSQL
jgi:Ca2+-binding EF-hand superfamily protein